MDQDKPNAIPPAEAAILNNKNDAPLPPPLKKDNKTVLIMVLVLVLIAMAVGIVLYINSSNQKKTAQTELNNKAIQSAVFELRRQTDEYYKEKKTYQNWQSNFYLETQVAQLGSKLVLAMPDYQTYVISAKLLDSNNYFCVDSKGFAGKLDAQPSKNSCK